MKFVLSLKHVVKHKVSLQPLDSGLFFYYASHCIVKQL